MTTFICLWLKASVFKLESTVVVSTALGSKFTVTLIDKGLYRIHPCKQFPEGKEVSKIENLRAELLPL